MSNLGRRVVIIYGTRPEFIKLAPVCKMLRAHDVNVDLICTGQHKQLLQPIYKTFGMYPDIELHSMREGQNLSQLTASMFEALSTIFSDRRYEYVVVQGDTTSALVGGMVGFYEKIPVGHVEAGLRTQDRYSPFPEEVNRRLLATVATHHFAPTVFARENLLREGIDGGTVVVTGNTVIDALQFVTSTCQAQMNARLEEIGLSNQDFILMTLHRRENIGDRVDNVLRAVRSFLVENPGYQLLLPLHRNPAIREPVICALESLPNATLVEALDYLTFCAVMHKAAFIVTDSGGIQEEAPYFNCRTLVTRDNTERPEAIEAGTAWLIGTEYEGVLKGLTQAKAEFEGGATPNLAVVNPFGMGDAASKICAFIEETLAHDQA